MENINPAATDPRVVAAELKRILQREYERLKSARRRIRERQGTPKERAKYRAKARAKERAKLARRRERDPDKVRSQIRGRNHRYRRRHPERAKESRKAWEKKNPNWMREKNRRASVAYEVRRRTDKVMVAALALHGELMPVLPLPST